MATKKKTVAKGTSIKNTQQEFINANEYIRDAYAIYGKHIVGSGFQEGRQFCDILDGLKISYRHYIQALYEGAKGFSKATSFLGDALKKYQFTGDASGNEVLANLANDYKCSEVQGNSGTRTMSLTAGPSAARYVEYRLKDEIRSQLDKIFPYVPSETTITGYEEKRYIPTPIPLALIAGTGAGMGIGIANNLPAFTATSLLDAYLNDDPYRLRANYGYTLSDLCGYDDENLWFDHETNKVLKWSEKKNDWIESQGVETYEPSEFNKEQLQLAWSGEKFKLELGIPMYRCEIKGVQGIMVVCDPKWFPCYRSSQIEEWEQAGYIEVKDVSDELGKMFFNITDGTRKVKLDDLAQEIWYNCGLYKKKSFDIKISTGAITGRVGIGQWLNFTYNNYKKLYKEYISDELSKLEFQEALWTNFEFVADKLIHYKPEEMSDKQVCDACNKDKKLAAIHKKHPELKCTLDIVHAIGQKAINTLRNADSQSHLDKIYEDRKYFKGIKVEDEIVSFVNCWDNL